MAAFAAVTFASTAEIDSSVASTRLLTASPFFLFSSPASADAILET